MSIEDESGAIAAVWLMATIESTDTEQFKVAAENAVYITKVTALPRRNIGERPKVMGSFFKT